MIILAIQLAMVEQVTPKSRPASGWISEHNTQIKGPALMAKPVMKISSTITAAYCSAGLLMPVWNI
ncbi:hypothetical protein D3C75_1203950 [compost metagenome]